MLTAYSIVWGTWALGWAGRQASPVCAWSVWWLCGLRPICTRVCALHACACSLATTSGHHSRRNRWCAQVVLRPAVFPCLKHPLPGCCAVRALQAACQPATPHRAAPHVCLCLPSHSLSCLMCPGLERIAHVCSCLCLGYTKSLLDPVALTPWPSVGSHAHRAGPAWLVAVHCPCV